MTHFAARAGRPLTFSDEALRAFLSYRWPGNVRELMNVVEQLVWLSATGVVGINHLPPELRAGPAPAPVPVQPLDDRRRQVADELYDAVVTQGASFWEHVYPMFLARDITRHDLRELVRRGLRESNGRYKSLLELFGMPSSDYRRFMNFLGAHGCGVAVREFRMAISLPDNLSGTSPDQADTADAREEELAPVR
jgi:DNA-binding NtrC family response regulator